MICIEDITAVWWGMRWDFQKIVADQLSMQKK
jgi:hypothetical protein